MSSTFASIRSLQSAAAPVVQTTTLVVSATAGSGKTTTALDAISNLFRRAGNNCPKNTRHTAEQKAILAWVKSSWQKCVPVAEQKPEAVQFLAFNKSIATELQKKLGGGTTGPFASTMHSFGVKLVYAHFPKTLGVPKTGLRMDNYKTSNLYQRYVGAISWKDLSKDQRVILDDLKEVLGTAKDMVKTERDFVRDSMPDEVLRDPSKLDKVIAAEPSILEAFEHFLFENNIDVPTEASVLLAPFLYCLHASTWFPEFDYDDMIYLPNRFGWKSSRPLSLIVVDEAQDLSYGKQQLICSQPCYVRVFIGDRNQAIYGFAGADCRSMDTIKTTTKAHELPLTYSFRCASAVVAYAAQFVPPGSIQAAPSAPTGEVVHMTDDKLLPVLQANDLIVCRTNAPLMSFAWRLLKAGRPALLIGGNLGRSLTTLVKKHSNQGEATAIENFTCSLQAFINRAVEQLQSWNSDTTERQIALLDQRDSLLELSIGCTTVGDLLARLEKLFSTEAKANAIRLSSIHRAKGLEAHRVFWLRPESCPHPMAKTSEARLQEKNLQFVASSRAIKSLHLVARKTTEPDDSAE